MTPPGVAKSQQGPLKKEGREKEENEKEERRKRSEAMEGAILTVLIIASFWSHRPLYTWEHLYGVQSLLIVAIHGVRPPGELGPASP